MTSIPIGTHVLILPRTVGVLRFYMGRVGIVTALPEELHSPPDFPDSLYSVTFNDKNGEDILAYRKELLPVENLSKLDKAYYGL